MASRNYNWAPLGYLCDPIPGLPDDLDCHAGDFRATAQTLGTAATSLERLQGTEDMCSETVTAIMARAKEASGTLKTLQFRYETIARALEGYSPELRKAQSESLAALEEATQAKNRARYARARAHEVAPGMLSSDTAVRNQAVAENNRCVAEVNTAQSAINSARERLRKAIDARDDAGDSAASQIRAVVDDSSLNDTFLDKVGAVADFLAEKVGEALTWVWDHLEAICLVLDAIALILMILPIPGAAALGGLILSATWIAGMIKGAVEVAGDSVAVVKGVVTALTTGNWEPVAIASVSLGFSMGFLALSVISGPAATPVKPLAVGITRVAFDVGKEVFPYVVGEVWELVEADSERRTAPERRSVLCF